MIHGDRVFDCMHCTCRSDRGRPDDGSIDLVSPSALMTIDRRFMAIVFVNRDDMDEVHDRKCRSNFFIRHPQQHCIAIYYCKTSPRNKKTLVPLISCSRMLVLDHPPSASQSPSEVFDMSELFASELVEKGIQDIHL